MFNTLAATALVASGAAGLEPVARTRIRRKDAPHAESPVAVRSFAADHGDDICGACSVAGLIYLALAVNLLTSVLGAITLVSYLFIYTPLKRVTWLNTAIGAIPGALPPLMGWTAARGALGSEGWTLFAILFFLATAAFFRHRVALQG